MSRNEQRNEITLHVSSENQISSDDKLWLILLDCPETSKETYSLPTFLQISKRDDHSGYINVERRLFDLFKEGKRFYSKTAGCVVYVSPALRQSKPKVETRSYLDPIFYEIKQCVVTDALKQAMRNF